MNDYQNTIALVLRLRSQGLSNREIGKRIGITGTTVAEWFARHEAANDGRYSDDQKARWAADADGTRTAAELSALWGVPVDDVKPIVVILRDSGHMASISKSPGGQKRTHDRYAQLAADVKPDSTSATLAEKWSMTRAAVSQMLHKMRQKGYDVPHLDNAISLRRHGPPEWLPDCDGTRTITDLARLWHCKYDAASKRITEARKDGWKVPVKYERKQAAPKAAPPKRQKKAAPKPAPKHIKAPVPAKPRVDIAPKRAPVPPSKVPSWHRYVADVQGRTVEDLAELWNQQIAGTMVRLRAMVDAGAIEAMPARRPKPPTEHQQKMQAVKDQRAQWAAEADGTRTTDELCSLWRTTPEGVWDRVRNLRKRGFVVSVSRDRKPPVRVERPKPVAEPVMQSSYVPTMHLALPKVPWLAMGVCNVLGWPWVAFAQTVKARTGETIRPGDMLSDEHAQRVLALFNFTPSVAA